MCYVSLDPSSRPLILLVSVVVQLADDHLGYLLRWASMLNGHKRTLALLALRPTKSSVHPGPTTPEGKGGDRSRYYGALWRHAVTVVLRVSGQ